MKDNITNKSILLIADPFFGYWKVIKDTLLDLGAKSVYFKQAPFYRGSLRDKINIPSLFAYVLNPRVRTQWTKKLKEEIKDKQFDTLLVVEKMPFSKDFLDYLRIVNPSIRCILFLWDTFRTQQSRYLDFLPKFDAVYSFDRDDATQYHLRYYPDFYIEGRPIPIEECKYDISFVGSMSHGETKYRAKTLYQVNEFCKKYHLKSFLYLKHYPLSDNPLRKIYQIIKDYMYAKQIWNYQKYGFLYSKALPLELYNKISAESKVLLDISHPDRQGMTINAITALASGKKLITTNSRIKEESFYDPNMIYVWDDKNPNLDIKFFDKPYQPIDMSYLRMDNWLKHIVNEHI